MLFRSVVSVVEAREGSQSASEVSLAQLWEQSLDSRSLGNGAGEAGEELETVARFVEISNVDEVLVFLYVLDMVLWMGKLATNSCQRQLLFLSYGADIIRSKLNLVELPLTRLARVNGGGICQAEEGGQSESGAHDDGTRE